MQIVCWGLVNVIDKMFSNDKNHWINREFREHIYDNSQGIFIGFINLHLGEFITNREQEDLFNAIISETKNYFLYKGDYISETELNNFQLIKETKREWLSPLETKRIIKILDYLEDLVNDKIRTKDSDEFDHEF